MDSRTLLANMYHHSKLIFAIIHSFFASMRRIKFERGHGERYAFYPVRLTGWQDYFNIQTTYLYHLRPVLVHNR